MICHKLPEFSQIICENSGNSGQIIKEITFNFSLYTPFFLNGCEAFSIGKVSNILTFALVNVLWLFFCPYKIIL
jgi:hypothetical protein